MSDDTDVTQDNPSTRNGRPGGYHVGGGSSGGFSSRTDARRASGDEIGAQMEEVGMDSNFWLDRAIATVGNYLGLPPNPKNVEPEVMFSIGGAPVRAMAELSRRASRFAREAGLDVVADYPNVASTPQGAPVVRKAAVERSTATQRQPGDFGGGHDEGGREDRPPDVTETPSDVASQGGGKKKVVARRHRYGSGRGKSTLLTGPLGVVGDSRIARKKLLGS